MEFKLTDFVELVAGMKLYKYLSPGRIDVLTHCHIRYTQPGAFNDPFEAKPYISKIAEDEEAERTVGKILPEEIEKSYNKLPLEVKRVFSYKTILDLASQYRESFRGEIGGILAPFAPMLRRMLDERFNELLGIFSLTEKPDNLLMWSHYATSHEGFVLGFESTHEYFDQRKTPKDEFRHLRKVEYRLNRPNAPLTTLRGVDVFLVKSQAWEYEQEWRIMRPLVEASEIISADRFPIHLFEYPPSAVVEIILGARIHEADRTEILNIVKHNKHFSHVEVFQALPNDMKFKIEIVKCRV